MRLLCVCVCGRESVCTCVVSLKLASGFNPWPVLLLFSYFFLIHFLAFEKENSYKKTTTASLRISLSSLPSPRTPPTQLVLDCCRSSASDFGLFVGVYFGDSHTHGYLGTYPSATD